MPTDEQDYSITRLQELYLEANPGASRSKARREAQKKQRELTANPGRVLGIFADPTPADAIRNLTNDRAAARRLGLA